MIKDELQMRIYQVEGEISAKQRFLDYMKATLRVVEAEETVIMKVMS